MLLSLDQLDRMLVLSGRKQEGESWASYVNRQPYRDELLEHWPKVAKEIEKAPPPE